MSFKGKFPMTVGRVELTEPPCIVYWRTDWKSLRSFLESSFTTFVHMLDLRRRQCVLPIRLSVSLQSSSAMETIATSSKNSRFRQPSCGIPGKVNQVQKINGCIRNKLFCFPLAKVFVMIANCAYSALHQTRGYKLSAPRRSS